MKDFSFSLQLYDISNVFGWLQLCVLAFWSLAEMFVFCETSERVIGRFDEIDIYNQCDWYSFPIRVQRIIPIIVISTQQSVVLEAFGTRFGNIPFSRETFERVISLIRYFSNHSIHLHYFQVARGGFSYFMVLRQFIRWGFMGIISMFTIIEISTINKIDIELRRMLSLSMQSELKLTLSN